MFFRGGAAIGALTLAMGSAVAQQTPAPTPPSSQTQPAVDQTTPAQQQGQGDRVVVTGSRIARDAFTSTAPIQVITAEASTLEGLVDTTEILQGSSIAQGSVQFNNTFGNFVIEGGPGINSVSLRGLGAQRSLVLLNGQRPGPAGVRGQVAAFDLNVMPDSIINRVEILKDGASSIYGSDAVAGVVNIITRSSVDSPELTVQYNATEQGGGNTLQVTGAIGWDVWGGNIMLAAEYEDRDPLKWGDRRNLSCAQDLIYDATTGQRIDRLDRSVIGGTSLGGCTTGNLYHNTVIDAVGGARYVPSPNGVTTGPFPGYRPRSNRTYLNSPDGLAYFEDVLNSPKFADGYAISAVERTSLYGKADFNIFGGVDWTTEVLLNRREFEQKSWRQFFPQIANNAWYDVPGAYQAPATFVTTTIAGIPTRVAQPVTIWPSNDSVTVDYGYINSGLTGDFFLPGWTWQLNASYSMSDGEYSGNEILKETAGDWNYTSPSDGLYHGPNYNPFDPAFLSGNYSDAVFDMLTGYSVGSTTYEQTVVSGVLTGDVFELPAGPLGLAVGAEWRNFEIDDTPDERSQNDEFWGSTSALVTRGEDTVTEAFAEVNVPILKGVPFFEELTLDGSVRAFDYDSYGSDSVWKAGLNWQVIPSVRLRGTLGTSYRAPALYELFLGNQTGFLSQASIDPCINWGNSTNPDIQANCASEGIPANYTGLGSSATIISGGGAGVLQAETSEASTLGVIWTPDFIDLSLAIDYFDITIDDEVAQLGASAILGGCYGSPVFPNAFCSLFTRNPGTTPGAAWNITTVMDSYINVNNQSTRGIDITLRYEHEFNFGDLSVDLSATQTLEDVVNLFDPSVVSGFETNDFNGSIGDPEWVGDATIQLRRGDFTYSWFIDYIGKTDNRVLGIDEVIPYQGRTGRRIITTDDWLSHDVSVRWRGDKVTVTGGVANLFDAQPPVVSNGAAQRLQNYALAATQYDLRGRTFFLRVGYEF
ncbi:MAG TPA: TonB-dependent receptor [Thermomicrobiales bacterium]|nr:TonB-dependent receptor [Thermomicrobiales bacterium]